ncbi:phosphatidylglycerol lysyltransferase domain-containing protein [Longispora albida]|uniref:phosphatidylglycerol lysyltransferase domain-containing protein n=1 Tax=Longispora albida TaxID=203523 RepID=UPI00036F9367|nr:phosphatidylglycerol lysyltransferase domain-containing protein [Longispora albida]
MSALAVRLAGGWSRVWAAIRRAPLILGCVALLWLVGLVGLVSGAVVTGPSEDVTTRLGIGLRAFADGHWWSPLTSPLFCMGPWSYVLTTLLFLVPGVPAERRLGARATAAILLFSQVAGCVLGVGLIKLGTLAGETSLSLVSNYNQFGASPAAAGLGLALSCRLSALWRRRTRLILVGGLLLWALYAGDVLDWVRLCGGLAGLALGIVIYGRSGRLTAPSHAETRVLVGMLVAGGALGALLTVAVPDALGPLSSWRSLLVSPVPGKEVIDSYCADPEFEDICRELRGEGALGGLLGLVLSAVPALLLLVAAEGLRRGRRLAWWIALLVNLMMLGLVAWTTADNIANPLPLEAGESRISVARQIAESAEPMLLVIVTIVVLLAARRHFAIRVPRGQFLSFVLYVLGTLTAVGFGYVWGGALVASQFDPEANLGSLFADFPKRLLPPVYQSLFGVGLLPDGPVARILFGYTGLVFWLVTLAGLLVLFWRTRAVTEPGAAARAREVLKRGGSNLSYMTMWEGNHYWFTPGGKSAVAYRVINGIAVTTGDPIGLPAERAEAVAGFAEFCATQGWTPCFYSVTEDSREAALDLGWRAVQVAEDTVLALAELKFSGKKWQDVRTALNNAAKAGITAQWYTFPEAPLPIAEQVREISEEWVADKGMPEMGFTLGGLSELEDRSVRILVAVDADGKVHGVTSWLPVYRDGEPIGWTLDFMRRGVASGPDGTPVFRGVMEFLIASAALSFKDEGAEFLSLSGAPLARLDRGEQPTALQRLLDFTGRTLEPVYGFRSLFAFKAKFQPAYEPMYMAYPDPAALPAIASAIGRAYLPHLTPGQGLRMIRSFTR